MTELTDTLQSLLQICRDGIAFYRDASSKVRDVEAREIFGQMIQVRQRLIDEFGELLLERGEYVPEGKTLAGSMRQMYTDISACLGDNADGIYVSELEEAEDRLLHSIEDAVFSSESPEVVMAVRRFLPVARDAHEKMRSLKRRKGA